MGQGGEKVLKTNENSNVGQTAQKGAGIIVCLVLKHKLTEQSF